MAAISTINSTPSDNYSIEQPKKTIYWTSTKIRQVALYFFTACLAAAGVIGACLASTPLELLTILPIFFSLYLGHKTYKIKDYERPNQLKFYQQEAPTLTFSQLVDKHGLKNITKFDVLPFEALKEKFNQQVQNMDFSSVLSQFPAQELLTYKITTPEHVALLKDLKAQGDKHRDIYDARTKKVTDDKLLRKARQEYNYKMNQLEEQYNAFKQTLLTEQRI